MSHIDTGFNTRLAYLRWLRARGRAAPETDRELAAAAGVGYPWFQKWKTRTDAPDSRELGRKLCRGLDADEAWLLDGIGAPPEPGLWKVWTSTPAKNVAQEPPMYHGQPVKSATAKKKRKRP